MLIPQREQAKVRKSKRLIYVNTYSPSIKIYNTRAVSILYLII